MFCLGDRNRNICDSAAGTNVKVKNNLSAEYSHHFEIYPGMQIHTMIQTSEMWWLIGSSSVCFCWGFVSDTSYKGLQGGGGGAFLTKDKNFTLSFLYNRLIIGNFQMAPERLKSCTY